jgi:uncharacterized NAD(P)/FAD-binding protein YdhS
MHASLTAPIVAIVGAGASGTLAAIHVLRRARRPTRVVLIDRQSPPGKGVAYGTTDPLHLLNVRAAGMSAFADDPQHLASWAKSDPAEFLPRQLYARYLSETLRAAQADASSGVTLEVRRDEVIDLSDDACALHLSSGEWMECARVVLALGNFSPRHLRLASANCFFQLHQDPWSPSALEGLGSGDAVLLVGTGLTMVDVVVSLIGTRGHRGQIYAVSRRGQLPQVHAEIGPQPAPAVEDLPPSALGALRAVRRAATREADWRSIVDGLRPVTQSIWQSFSPVERERFVRHVQPYWDTHRHRIAPRVGQLVAEARDADQLHVFAGRLVAANGAQVHIKLRNAGERWLEVKRVINCTGPETNPVRLEDPLVQHLLERGLASADSLGLGFNTVAGGRLVDARGQASQRVLSLGPMRRAELWETIAVPDIRVQAAELAELLVSELGA